MNNSDTKNKTIDLVYEAGETIKEERVSLNMSDSRLYCYKFFLTFIVNNFDDKSMIIFEVIDQQRMNCLVEIISDGYMAYNFFILSRKINIDGLEDDPPRKKDMNLTTHLVLKNITTSTP